MKERPILFSAPMVRAILEGRKTQTRREISVQVWRAAGCADHAQAVSCVDGKWQYADNDGWQDFRAPVAPFGDARLWVRENGWERPERTPKMMREGADTWERYYYDADVEPRDHVQTREQFKAWGFKRRPSIHMPRWACRILLEVTGVRTERLQDISAWDCEAEGCGHVMPFSAQQMYRQLWVSINGASSWNENPWVWVIEFKRT